MDNISSSKALNSELPTLLSLHDRLQTKVADCESLIFAINNKVNAIKAIDQPKENIEDKSMVEPTTFVDALYIILTRLIHINQRLDTLATHLNSIV